MEIDRKKLLSPVYDLRYLYNRKYNPATALRVVSDRYLLNEHEINLLRRAVFSKNEARENRDRLIDKEEIRDSSLLIDGYNVLITVEAFLKGEPVIFCDDEVVRDISGVYGKYKESEFTWKALDMVLDFLQDAGPSEFIILFDSGVSHSGELSFNINRRIWARSLKGSSKTSPFPDKEICVSPGSIHASSDRVIIMKSERILDIPGNVIPKEGIKHLCPCKDK